MSITFNQVTGGPGVTFSDISSEESRTYIFPKGEKVIISAPIALNVSKSGGHKVVDSEGVTHYIPPGWIELQWISGVRGNHVDF